MSNYPAGANLDNSAPFNKIPITKRVTFVISSDIELFLDKYTIEDQDTLEECFKEAFYRYIYNGDFNLDDYIIK